MSQNPLLQKSIQKHGACEFQLYKEDHYVPAFKQAIEEARANINEIKKLEASFDNTIIRLELADQLMSKVSHIYHNLFSAEATEKLQSLAGEISALNANFSSDVLLDHELFKKVNLVYQDKDKLNLDTEQMMLLENTHKMFRRNGALLNDEKKEELRKLDEELAQLAPKFSENVLKDTNAFELVITDKKDLSGLPESAIAAAREEAIDRGYKKECWIISLDAPSFIPFVKYCNNRELRQKVWFAYNSRCTNGNTSNKENVNKIVSLRHKRAKLLGYKHHADYVLQERMAKSTDSVMDFLNKLIKASKPAAERDKKEVEDFAKSLGHEDKVQAWDFAYYSEKLKKQKYDFDPELLRPYFSLDKVTKGAFDLASKLFAINFKRVEDYPVYHKDVEVYEVYNNSDNSFVGLFYADFFPRATKRGGAWMTSYKEQGFNGNEVERPHVAIVCNFTKPTSDKPSLLTFEEVETLFHEFGHSLHGLLSKCHFKSLSGTNVYWDFVELPSQFMENFLLEKEVLDLFADHYESGEKIPKELIEKLQKASKFQSGYFSLRQLNFGLLDMSWHGSYIENIEDIEAFEIEKCKSTNLFDHQDGTMSSTAFSHIFAGGYSAGYYSYKWAEVLDADAYEAFKEQGLFNEKVANAFKQNILEKGGTEHPMELYEKFRGREPDTESLLRRDGLI